jgi:hypothetical protein
MLLVSCSRGDGDASSTTAAERSTTSTTEVVVPVFAGEADSEYCRLAGELITVDLEDAPESLRAFYERFDESADQLAELAPDDIAEDVERFVAGVRSIREPLEAAGFESSKLDPAEVPVLQDPEFPASGNRVVAYSQQVCAEGIPDDAPDPGT